MHMREKVHVKAVYVPLLLSTFDLLYTWDGSFCVFFSVRLLSFGFFIPATTANDLRLRRIFYPRFYPLPLFSCLNSWERASIFPFECSVLNKGTTGTIFITSLVWRSPWLGIEPGTSRTRSQHYTTWLSRRRWDGSRGPERDLASLFTYQSQIRLKRMFYQRCFKQGVN